MSHETTHNEQHGNAHMTQQVDRLLDQAMSDLIQNAAAQPYYAGSIYSQQYAQQAALKGPPPHAMRKNQHRWMINGRTMTWQQFLDEMAPGDDNPQRTFLMLKYGGWNE